MKSPTLSLANMSLSNLHLSGYKPIPDAERSLAGSAPAIDSSVGVCRGRSMSAPPSPAPLAPGLVQQQRHEVGGMGGCGIGFTVGFFLGAIAEFIPTVVVGIKQATHGAHVGDHDGMVNGIILASIGGSVGAGLSGLILGGIFGLIGSACSDDF